MKRKCLKLSLAPNEEMQCSYPNLVRQLSELTVTIMLMKMNGHGWRLVDQNHNEPHHITGTDNAPGPSNVIDNLANCSMHITGTMMRTVTRLFLGGSAQHEHSHGVAVWMMGEVHGQDQLEAGLYCGKQHAVVLPCINE